MAGPELGNVLESKDHSATMATIARNILDDTFYNIIYDIVAKAHRDEKVARTRSAVITVKHAAEAKCAPLPGEATDAHQNGEPPSDERLSQVTAETDAALFQEGRVYLKGNPMLTTEEIMCPNCRLPRLRYPLWGEGSRPPPDPNREYCRKIPPVRMPGRDVHGHPFSIEKGNKKKKTQDPENTPRSSPPNTKTSTTAASLKLPDQVYIPTTKCPNCPRYFLVTKSAQHLDRCMGITTRQSSRNRTPFDSGLNTPAAQAAASRKRVRLEDEEPAAVSKKRKEVVPTKLKTGKPVVPSKLKNGTTPDGISAAASPAKTAKKIKLTKPAKERELK